MKKPKISKEEFLVLLKYIDAVDWDTVIENYRLPLREIDFGSVNNKQFWNCISKYQYLPTWFIEKYQDKVDWDIISTYQKLSEPFIEKHKDKVDWYGIIKVSKIVRRIH